MSRQPTIRDVAERAGVSHQTVSRVINGHDLVSAETRRRVEEAIRELNYVPSPIARGLNSNRTHSIGLVSTNISDHFFAEVAAGAEIEARRHGYYLVIASVEEHTEADERAYLRLMLERRVEGLIVARPRLPISTDQVGPPLEVPLVAIASSESPGLTVVDVDNRRGGLDAVSFLVARGHTRVATITGPTVRPCPARGLPGRPGPGGHRGRALAGRAGVRLGSGGRPGGNDSPARAQGPVHGAVRLQRPDRDRGDQGAAGRQAARPGGRFGGRLRRHSRGRLPGAAAHHGQPADARGRRAGGEPAPRGHRGRRQRRAAPAAGATGGARQRRPTTADLLERRSRIRGARRRRLLSPQVTDARHRYMTGALANVIHRHRPKRPAEVPGP